MTTQSACGKLILFGEHAVVYGRPALAVPLGQLRARASVAPRREPGIVVYAPDVRRTVDVHTAPADDPLALVVRLALAQLGVTGDYEITVQSDIPVASGMGSGAAISTAIVRALAAHTGRTLTPEQVSELVYETERLYHGTPSGVDNTVIAYEQPIRFVRGQGVSAFRIARPFALVIANTGIASPTRITVGDVRRGWEAERERYEEMFDRVAAIVEQAQRVLERGANRELGELMLRNQELIRLMDVSSAEIEQLLEAGLRAGASGGKLSGGGRGGNVIFYAEGADWDALRAALTAGGAKQVIRTIVGN